MGLLNAGVDHSDPDGTRRGCASLIQVVHVIRRTDIVRAPAADAASFTGIVLIRRSQIHVRFHIDRAWQLLKFRSRLLGILRRRKLNDIMAVDILHRFHRPHGVWIHGAVVGFQDQPAAQVRIPCGLRLCHRLVIGFDDLGDLTVKLSVGKNRDDLLRPGGARDKKGAEYRRGQELAAENVLYASVDMMNKHNQHQLITSQSDLQDIPCPALPPAVSRPTENSLPTEEQGRIQSCLRMAQAVLRHFLPDTLSGSQH